VRLIGFAYAGSPTLDAGFVPLGELTVLLGPNDSGKSTVLRRILDCLGGHAGGILFGEVSAADLDVIVGHAAVSSCATTTFTPTLCPTRSKGG
jgi:ABC-type cobalamin/Fe3+-siderophores transport system ATPase subunit